MVCLITGGSGGLGAAIGDLFAREGAIIHLADLSDAPGRAVAERIGAGFHRLDVTDESAWMRAMDAIDAEHGRLDVLVNCAGASGIIGDGGLLDTSRWHTLFAINATGPFFGMKHAWPLLRRSSAPSVVNVTSISAAVAVTPAHPAYGASKAALSSLSRIMAVEMAQDGIRVNSVAPGILPVMSGLADDAAERATAHRESVVRTTVPLERVGDHLEVAAAVRFLASPDSSYVTGTELRVDGGFTAR